jgi:hypothetical protein
MRALSSVPQGGAGSLQSLSSSRRRVMASCLCWRAPCSSHLQTAERARAPDSAQSPWNRSRERTFENQWCRSPGRVGGCAVRIWFEPLVTEQVFCPYQRHYLELASDRSFAPSIQELILARLQNGAAEVNRLVEFSTVISQFDHLLMTL